MESGIWEDKKTWVQGKIRLTSHPSVKKKLEESEFDLGLGRGSGGRRWEKGRGEETSNEIH